MIFVAEKNILFPLQRPRDWLCSENKHWLFRDALYHNIIHSSAKCRDFDC